MLVFRKKLNNCLEPYEINVTMISIEKCCVKSLCDPSRIMWALLKYLQWKIVTGLLTCVLSSHHDGLEAS